jgi:hypothetical protein
MLNPCQILVDNSSKNGNFTLWLGLTQHTVEETPVQVNSNNQRASEPTAYECQINQN